MDIIEIYMLEPNFTVHRLISQCAPLRQCLGYQNIALNMPESYNGQKKNLLEVS